jgi:twitching motility protein PilT
MNRKAFNNLLKMAIEDGVTDVILAVGEPPIFRYHNTLMDVKAEFLEERDTELIARLLLQHRLEDIASFNAADITYEVPEVGRFRANVFKQRNVFRIILRVIPIEIRSFADLHLPNELSDIANLQRGLVLVTGATGQGKSTTLSAIIEYINRTRKAHIITIEDPIEFTYQRARGIVTQREINEDVPDYKTALRQALRQSPDVIMAAEVRDSQTFEAVLTAAETGHLTLAAIHTSDTQRTFTRILGFYPEQERQSLRERLSSNLSAIISLRLLMKKSLDERIPAVEILRVNSVIAECLRSHERVNEIYHHMERGRNYYGMRTFDQDIVNLYEKGLIDLATAIKSATHPANVERAISFNGK